MRRSWSCASLTLSPFLSPTLPRSSSGSAPRKHKQTWLRTDISDIWQWPRLYIEGNDNIYERDASFFHSLHTGCCRLLMSLSVYHYLWMKRRRKRGDGGSDRDERKVWMLLPHPLNYISSKIGGVGGSACHRRGWVGVSSQLPEAPTVHFFLLYFHEPSD